MKPFLVDLNWVVTVLKRVLHSKHIYRSKVWLKNQFHPIQNLKLVSALVEMSNKNMQDLAFVSWESGTEVCFGMLSLDHNNPIRILQDHKLESLICAGLCKRIKFPLFFCS
jgi:hypothetical protein